MIELEGFDEVVKAELADTPDQSIIDRLRFDDALDIPWQITDLDLWKNYTDDDLYELDRKLRQYFEKNRRQRERKKGLKTAVPLVFAWIFGRRPEAKDSQVCVKLHRLMKYYCTRYTGCSMINGVRFTRVYYFSTYSTRHKRPYSLRLRLELCNEDSFLQPYGSGRVKGPASEVDRCKDRGNGPGADEGSSAYIRGNASKASVSELKAKGGLVPGSSAVHRRRLQSGHQGDPDDHQQD